jgi:hypothetical protein
MFYRLRGPVPTYRIVTVGCDEYFLSMREIVERVDGNEAVDRVMQLASDVDFTFRGREAA